MRAIFLSVAFVASAALPPSVKTVEIAPGVQMPLVSLGTARGCPPNATIIEADVRMGLSVGFGGIDTATSDPCYDDAAVGRALKGVDRDSYFITTKIPSVKYVHPSQTSGQLEQSLRNLGLASVDLMLVHHPGQFSGMTFEESIQRQWAELEAFHKAGKARAIGVSNYCNRAMEAILKTATVKPAVNQVLYHAGMGEDADGIVSFSRAHNITLMAFSSSDEGNKVILHGEPYASIGAAHGKSGIQVALRWLVEKEMAYVIAADKRAYQEEDLDVFDFELTPAEIANINSQYSCQAGMRPPYCKLPYWPCDGDCCNLDGKGAQCGSELGMSI